MWPWLPVWSHSPAAVMWQYIPVYCAFILLLSCHWSWTSYAFKIPQLSRTSPDQGCASSSWDGIRDQGLFRTLFQPGQECLGQNVPPRTRELYCSPLHLLTEIFPRMHPEYQSHFKSVYTGNHNL